MGAVAPRRWISVSCYSTQFLALMMNGKLKQKEPGSCELRQGLLAESEICTEETPYRNQKRTYLHLALTFSIVVLALLAAFVVGLQAGRHEDRQPSYPDAVPQGISGHALRVLSLYLTEDLS